MGGIVNPTKAKIGNIFSNPEFYIVTEEWTGNVKIYGYVTEKIARDQFKIWFSSRIMFNSNGDEVDRAGMGLAHNTIRHSFNEWFNEKLMKKSQEKET